MPRPEEPHWFEELADHLGSAYLRYSFTKGTEQEVAFLVEALGLEPGMRVLDVGCGPGRHSLALASRGIETVGVDISERFVELATAAAARLDVPASFARVDATRMRFDNEFDAAISLCQGAFGLQGLAATDHSVLTGIRQALVGGGVAAVSAFSSYFQVRYLSESSFDAATGVNHEVTSIRDDQGRERSADLWTTCFTPREISLMAAASGLAVDAIYSVEPGRYSTREPDIETPEFLALLRKGSGSGASASV